MELVTAEIFNKLELVTKYGVMNKTINAGDDCFIKIGSEVLILAQGVSQNWLGDAFFIVYNPESMESASVAQEYVDVIDQ